MTRFPLINAVPDALIIVDGAGRIERANQQAERLFGYPPDGLTGLGIEQLVPAEARQRHQAHRIGYIAAPRMRPMGDRAMTLAGLRRDGSQFPVEIALSPMQADDGVPFYVASIRDVSETRRARQTQVRARYDALVARIGQQALESGDADHVIASLPALLGEALDVDAIAVVFLRQNAELDVRFVSGPEPDALDEAQTLRLAQLLAQGQVLAVQDCAEAAAEPFPLYHATTGSGALVPLPDRERPMGALIAWSRQPRRFDHDAQHLLQSVANLLAALVQRRRTEEQLAHSQRLEAVGQLTGGIAHDFNNLLTVISGSLQLLQMQCQDRPEAEALIASALRSSGRAAELTEKLLAFARRQRLSPCAVVPAQILRELDLMLHSTLDESVRLRIQCPEDLPAAYVDPTQLEAALLNLALNARDAMPRGGDLLIAAEERRTGARSASWAPAAGRYVVFSVIDTGHGMTPETLAHAVEPFFTTKGQGRGTGLGLSMIYGFVKQSGGHVQIDSRLGYGTRVELYLPVLRAGDAAPTAEPAGATAPAPGHGESVLVVEDEVEVRGVAAAFLEALGYRVHAVASGEEALAHLAQAPDVDLLFSDVRLGANLGGRELATLARQRRPHLAVLLTSGHDAAVGTRDGPAIELLRKPYQREQLAAAVQRCLRRRGA
ncbi:PAS domain S-box protein [Cognatiluteimonas weifangensis]|uniref:histidine kinase n=1 Tax=Cognatiluteimonas weifangensis TaxID=2303539 RepID=A0A372DMH1_9GAMM|nr:PAS domain S-box protein [Luteimonas weifangensis]RFP60760.1 PAS domain S-box protein [Luteimonas weifangensis]